MKTLRILAWGLFFLISGTCNAAITVQATGAAVDRLIGANEGFSDSHHARYDESIGESHQSMLGRVLFGLAAQDNFAFGTGADVAYRIALDGDSILRRKYAVVLGILPDGSSDLTSEIDTSGPEPDEWAIIALCVGFVIYQMRPRNRLRATNLAGGD